MSAFSQLLISGQKNKTAAKPAAKAKPVSTNAKPVAKVTLAQKIGAVSKAGTTTRKANAKNAVIYALHDGSRPSAGGMLFAYTEAWLELSGLKAGGAIPCAMVKAIAGNTALTYHKNNQNLELSSAGVTLTPKGKAFFAARIVETKHVEGFSAVMTTGKINADVNVKNVTSIKKVAA